MGAHLIAWLFLGAMLFSLAYYERGEKTWRDETTYQVQVEHIAFGAPLPWLAHNRASFNGAPPPIELLPDGMEYLPGLHVDVPRLCLAVTIAFGVALALFALGWLVWPNVRRRGETPSARGLLAIACAAVLAAAIGPTDPPWIGLALLLLVVPIVISIACWKRAGVATIVVCSAVAVLCFVWVQRLAALLLPHRAAHDFDMHQDVVLPAAYFALYSLLVLAITRVKHSFAS